MDGKESSARITGVKNAWDVAVIGAGPAGALAALLLARRGLSTLLIERKKFPRDKVCGGCLNARAVATLRQLGVGSILDGPKVAAVNSLHLQSRRRRAAVAIPGGAAIARSEFDQDLAGRAQVSGAMLLTEMTAEVAPDVQSDLRRIVLRSRGRSVGDAYARIVLACDGLGNSSLSQLPNSGHWLRRRSRIGVGAIVDCCDDDIPLGAICMAIDPAGYVGRVRLGDGRTSIAAALDAGALRTFGPAGAINHILARCGIAQLARHANCRLHGTPPLTRRARRVADERVFVLGDACGYVEPFTGDGMSVALETGAAITPLVQAAQTAWRPEFIVEWQRIIRSISTRRHLTCRALSGICRHSWLADVALSCASRAPGIVASLVERMSRLPRELKGFQPWDCTSSA